MCLDISLFCPRSLKLHPSVVSRLRYERMTDGREAGARRGTAERACRCPSRMRACVSVGPPSDGSQPDDWSDRRTDHRPGRHRIESVTNIDQTYEPSPGPFRVTDRRTNVRGQAALVGALRVLPRVRPSVTHTDTPAAHHIRPSMYCVYVRAYIAIVRAVVVPSCAR